MRKDVRIPTLIAAVVAMLLTAVPIAGAQELSPGGTFIDDDATIYEPSIEALVAAGITDGCSTDRYCYRDPVTRGQMASFLDRSLGLSQAGAQTPFGDAAGNVHVAAIGRVAAAGVAQGFDDGTFRPDAPVTRAQMASFLSRAYLASRIPEAAALPHAFADVPDGNVHTPLINLLATEGLTTGCGQGRYCPTDPVRRGQMATFLMKALRR